jgi:hypothetical protein
MFHERERKAAMRGGCRVPDDSIQNSRWPLFFAREVPGGVRYRPPQKK